MHVAVKLHPVPSSVVASVAELKDTPLHAILQGIPLRRNFKFDRMDIEAMSLPLSLFKRNAT